MNTETETENETVLSVNKILPKIGNFYFNQNREKLELNFELGKSNHVIVADEYGFYHTSHYFDEAECEIILKFCYDKQRKNLTKLYYSEFLV